MANGILSQSPKKLLTPYFSFLTIKVFVFFKQINKKEDFA